MRRALLAVAVAVALVLGLPGPAPSAAAGRLVHGVQLPAQGFDFLTWDPVFKHSPNRGWRRWGTPELIDATMLVLRDYRDAHPGAPRVLIGDLSRPHGGYFGSRYGGLGHATHQAGLDVDVYYPRRDHLARAPTRPAEVDVALAQDLVTRFVAAGAINVYVGPDLPLRGKRGIVSKLIYHDDHLHVRFAPN